LSKLSIRIEQRWALRNKQKINKNNIYSTPLLLLGFIIVLLLFSRLKNDKLAHLSTKYYLRGQRWEAE